MPSDCFPDKYCRDLRSVISANYVDFVCLAGCECRKDVESGRALVRKLALSMVLVKITDKLPDAVLQSLIDAADGVVLDLDNEIKDAVKLQHSIIRRCNEAGVPIIVRTASPSSGKLSDPVQIVKAGADCVMLCGETSRGAHPQEIVRHLKESVSCTEQTIDYAMKYSDLHRRQLTQHSRLSVAESIASSAVKTSFDLEAPLIILLTASGSTARLVAKYSPHAIILCVTDKEQAAKQIIISRGAVPLLVACITGSESIIMRALQVARKIGWCNPGDNAVVCKGSKCTSALSQSSQDYTLQVADVPF